MPKCWQRYARQESSPALGAPMWTGVLGRLPGVSATTKHRPEPRGLLTTGRGDLHERNLSMLVLKRTTNEKVNLYIGDKLLGEVFYLGNGKAPIGFRFGPEIRIVRAEVDEAEQARKDEGDGRP